jgi:hypothetical protein
LGKIGAKRTARLPYFSPHPSRRNSQLRCAPTDVSLNERSKRKPTDIDRARMTEVRPIVSQRCARLRELGPEVAEAFRKSIEAEGTPEHSGLEAEYLRLEEEFERLAREVWSTPVQTWQDVIERAEIAYAYGDSDLVRLLLSDDLGTRAAAELLMAVLRMAGAPTWRCW